MGFLITKYSAPDEQAVQCAIGIQIKLAIFDDLQARNLNIAPNGVLISKFASTQFQNNLQAGSKLWLAKESRFGRSVGYLFANTGKQFIAQHPDTEIRWGDSDIAKRQWNPTVLKNLTILIGCNPA